MAHVRIEMDRGRGWEMRQEGEADVTADQLREQLPAYAIQYPHRAILDGEVVVEVQPKAGKVVETATRRALSPDVALDELRRLANEGAKRD